MHSPLQIAAWIIVLKLFHETTLPVRAAANLAVNYWSPLLAGTSSLLSASRALNYRARRLTSWIFARLSRFFERMRRFSHHEFCTLLFRTSTNHISLVVICNKSIKRRRARCNYTQSLIFPEHNIQFKARETISKVGKSPIMALNKTMHNYRVSLLDGNYKFMFFLFLLSKIRNIFSKL